MTRKRTHEPALRIWKYWIRPLLPIVLTVIAFRSSIADWSNVPTGSMKPTIVEGDRIFINKTAYSLRFPLTRWHLIEFGEPKHGDIVVFKSPHDGKRLVKRVVATAGDSISMRNGILSINGTPLNYEPMPLSSVTPGSEDRPANWVPAVESLPGRDHPVLGQPTVAAKRDFARIVVPPDHFFALGDNRDDSFDSRFFGPVHRDSLYGSSTHVALSFNPDRHYLPRWNRFFQKLP